MSEPELFNVLRNCVSGLPGLRIALLFGSAAKAALGRDSDIDLALLCSQPLSVQQRMQLVGDVAALTGRAVDVIDLSTAGEPLLGQVLMHGKRLYGTDDEQAALMRRHWLDVADFLPYAKRMLDSRRSAWTGT